MREKEKKAGVYGEWRVLNSSSATGDDELLAYSRPRLLPPSLLSLLQPWVDGALSVLAAQGSGAARSPPTAVTSRPLQEPQRSLLPHRP